MPWRHATFASLHPLIYCMCRDFVYGSDCHGLALRLELDCVLPSVYHSITVFLVVLQILARLKGGWC